MTNVRFCYKIGKAASHVEFSKLELPYKIRLRHQLFGAPATKFAKNQTKAHAHTALVGVRSFTKSSARRRCPMSGYARGLRNGLARMYSINSFSKKASLSLGVVR